MLANAHEMIQRLAAEQAKQKESFILESLNELISRGILVVEETQPVLVHDELTSRVRVSQMCRLVLKDKEYIEKLERENTLLREALASLGPIRKNGNPT